MAKIKLSKQATVDNDIAFNSKKITELAPGVNNADAVNKGQMDSAISTATNALISGDLIGAMMYKGTYNASTHKVTISGTTQDIPTAAKLGWFFRVTNVGTQLGHTWELGDYLVINKDLSVAVTSADVDRIDNTDSDKMPLTYLDTTATLASNSDTKVPSQKAVKAYVDGVAGGKAALSHSHTKSEVGLGNVDNTSDASKPISTAAQTALDAKMPMTYLDTTATLAANSDTKVPSQKAIKAYVDGIAATKATTADTYTKLQVQQIVAPKKYYLSTIGIENQKVYLTTLDVEGKTGYRIATDLASGGIIPSGWTNVPPIVKGESFNVYINGLKQKPESNTIYTDNTVATFPNSGDYTVRILNTDYTYRIEFREAPSAGDSIEIECYYLELI